MGGERLLPAGLSLAHPSGWAGRWGIGPGGHPMGGVSTALAELELSREGGGGSGAPTAHTPHALAVCSVRCRLPASQGCKTEEKESQASHMPAGGAQGGGLGGTGLAWGTDHLSSLCDHTDQVYIPAPVLPHGVTLNRVT